MKKSPQKQPLNDPQKKYSLPLDARIRLAHGLITHIFATYGVRSMHFKGYAAAGIFPATRHSTDVDVIIDPKHQDLAIRSLTENSWTLVTDYHQGSIFRHAASLWHKHLGYVDVHRWVPGLHSAPQQTFDALWRYHTNTHIAHYPCPTPSRLDHILLILLHCARDPHRGIHDAHHVWESLDTESKKQLRHRVMTFEAETPWKLATGEDLGADPHQLRIWAAIRNDANRTELLHARIQAERNPLKKTRLLLGAFVPNRSHLHIASGHHPTLDDYITEYQARISAVLESRQKK